MTIKIVAEHYADNPTVFTFHTNRPIQPQECTGDMAITASFPVDPNQLLLSDLAQIRGVEQVQSDRYQVHITIGKAFCGSCSEILQIHNHIVHTLVEHLRQPEEHFTVIRPFPIIGETAPDVFTEYLNGTTEVDTFGWDPDNDED